MTGLRIDQVAPRRAGLAAFGASVQSAFPEDAYFSATLWLRLAMK
jgi:hypothetical protein